jgi:hypothetical protein
LVGACSGAEDIGYIGADGVFFLWGDGFALREEDGSDCREWKFDLEIVECGRERGFKRGTDERFEAFPGKDDFAAFKGLFCF